MPTQSFAERIEPHPLYERKVENFLGLVQLACILILLKAFLR